MTKFNFTADELNEILGWNKCEAKHSTRYNLLRKKFADMDEDQFNEVYRAFYDGSTGIISAPTTKLISEKEAEVTNFILTLIASSNFPISFSDAYFSNKLAKIVRGYDLRDRVQKIIDALEKTHKVEGLRVIKIMTQGTCHIKLYEIR